MRRAHPGRVLIRFDYVRFAPTTTVFARAQQVTQWAKTRSTRCEQFGAALPYKAGLKAPDRNFADGP